MAIRITNLPTQLLINDETAKNIQYVLKEGLSVSASNGRVIVQGGSTTYVSATPNEISEPVTNSLLEMVETLHGYVDDNPVNLFSGGWGDYTDTFTSGAPITLTGGAGMVQLTNNKASSNETKLPYGVDTLWNSSSNRIVLDGLSVGDLVGVRATMVATTATANTEIEIELAGGASGAAFTVPIGKTTDFKTVKSYTISHYTEFYIGNADVLNNGVMIRASAEKTCTMVVTGWLIKAIKVGNQ